MQIKDFTCAEFEALVKNNTDSQTIQHQMRVMFEHIERDWKNQLSRQVDWRLLQDFLIRDLSLLSHGFTRSLNNRFVVGQMMDASGNHVRDVDSSFAMNLKTLSWVPGLETQCTADPEGEHVRLFVSVLHVVRV